MAPPRLDLPFIVYIAANETTNGSILIQEVDGKKRVVYYLSRRLLDVETRYSEMERLCLCLYFKCTKLRHYLLNAETMVPPSTKKVLQELIGKINYIRRFIPNLSAKLEAFMPLIKTQRSEEFVWGQISS